MDDFNVIWVDQPNKILKIKKYDRQSYACRCNTEKTSLNFRDWLEMKKERQPENCKGLFIHDIMPSSPIAKNDEDIIIEPSYLIRCDWINKTVKI